MNQQIISGHNINGGTDMSDIIETLRAHPHTIQAIGVFGFMLYIGAFSAIQTGRLCGNSIIFSINQVVAACCVLISLAGAFNLASFLIQVSYIGIGSYGIALRWRRAHPKTSLLPRTSQGENSSRISTNQGIEKAVW